MTALIVAVKGGYTEVVKELLKRNPNVNMTDKDGNTALMIAAKEGYTEIVQDLLDAGTYVNIPDRVTASSVINSVCMCLERGQRGVQSLLLLLCFGATELTLLKCKGSLHNYQLISCSIHVSKLASNFL